MDAPSVQVLLDVDREYREKARAGSLPGIAPRRLNPEGRAWLPVCAAASPNARHYGLADRDSSQHSSLTALRSRP